MIIHGIEDLDFQFVEEFRIVFEQLFDGDMYDDDHMWLPSMDIDEQGYVALNIVVDNEGYAHFVND